VRGLSGLSSRQKAIACAKQALAIYDQIESLHVGRVRRKLAA
jgi:hypothetical protein